MSKFNFWSIGILITFIIVHVICMVLSKLTGGGGGMIVILTEMIASVLIFWTVKDDFKSN